MTNTESRSQEADDLFRDALDLPPGARAALLGERCRGRPELRREVEELLRLDALAPSRFLAGRRSVPRPPLPELAPGTRVDRYEIVRTLGSGGMGTVYEARQDRPHRLVALKIVRSTSPQLLLRLEHEAEALGALHHPGIAQILEAGAVALAGTDGEPVEVPFLAMELVQGEELRFHARAARLSVEERCELVARVGDAVQHAHQNGVIHRDLKPENILVVPPPDSSGARTRDIGQPKILDFGIARVARAVVEGGPALSTLAGFVAGTIGYMSPEQLSGEGRVDTRSDVYALGAILFELLTGRLPHELGGRSLFEAARAVRENESPRLRALDPALATDLETITAKALCVDPDRRYATAVAFSADLRRYLRGEPIVARSDSSFYVLTRILRRHRAVSAGALAFVLLLAAFAVVSSVQAKRNRDLATRERAAHDEVEGLSVQLRAEAASSNVERGRALAMAGQFQQAERILWREHLLDPDSPHPYWALWECYSRFPLRARLIESAINGPGTCSWNGAVRPDGRVFAFGRDDGGITLFDSDDLHSIAENRAGAAPVMTLDYDSSGALLAVGDLDGQIELWDGGLHERIRVWELGEGQIEDLCFSKDGTILYAASAEGPIRGMDVATGETRVAFEEDPGSFVRLALHPSGAFLAAGSEQGTIRLLELPGLLPTLEASAHAALISALAFSPDGARMASGSMDRTIREWDAATLEPQRTLEPSNGTVRGIGFRPIPSSRSCP